MESHVRPRPHGSPGRGVGIFPEEDDLVPLDQTEQAGRTVAVPAPGRTGDRTRGLTLIPASPGYPGITFSTLLKTLVKRKLNFKARPLLILRNPDAKSRL